MKQIFKFLVSICLLVLFTSMAQALQLNTEADVLNLEKGESIGTLVTITNDTFDVRNFRLKASTEDFDIKLLPAVRDFTLNPHETITFSITIVAQDDADAGMHQVDIAVTGD